MDIWGKSSGKPHDQETGHEEIELNRNNLSGSPNTMFYKQAEVPSVQEKHFI